MLKREIRTTPGTVEVRANEGEPTVITGYAAIFGELSQNLGGFHEQIEPGAFDDVLDNDVRALFNHNSNYILARTKSKTLKLSIDERGLKYEFEAPETQAARDLVISIKRGDISGSSFGFTVEDDNWSEDEEGRIVRTIKKVRELYDVGPVTFPAYEQTEATTRSLDTAKQEIEKRKNEREGENPDLLEAEIALLELE